jgi:hypothetical protein
MALPNTVTRDINNPFMITQTSTSAPLSLLLFGASSFLYELMPSGPNYIPDEATISSFFGPVKQSDGTYTFNHAEKISANWTNRIAPYSNEDVSTEIMEQYLEYPVLFGGSTWKRWLRPSDFGNIKERFSHRSSRG